MQFRAFGNRIAVHFPSLKLPIDESQAFEILERLGYQVIAVDLIALARQQIGRAIYRRGARLRDAPAVLDCSSFTVWLYGQRGIALPRYSIQQHETCFPVRLEQAKVGDLAFSDGCYSYYREDPKLGIGHVGIVTADKTVVHAANSKQGIIEDSLDVWSSWKSFKGVRRLIHPGTPLVTLETPPSTEIQTSDDIRWKILQHLPR